MTYVELKRRLVPLYGEKETQAILRMVLEMRFGLSHADILCGKVTQLSADDAEVLEKIIVRLEKNEPVQYILGHADFYGRCFEVNPDVLIPRPETEELCAWVIETAQQAYPRSRILDVGTGSGCIAVTLALELPCSQVEAWDISGKAIATAQQNAARLGATVNFKENDISKTAKTSMKWDIFVSNPPYITLQEQAAMEPNVLAYEPHAALFVPDNDALYFYRLICLYAASHLSEGGMVFFEINPLFAEDVRETLQSHGFTDIILKNDAFGKQRFIRGTRKTQSTNTI